MVQFKTLLIQIRASRDSRVESSSPVKFLKTISNLSLFFNFYPSKRRCLFFSLVMRVWNLNIVLLNGFPDSFQQVLRISIHFDVLYN